MNNQDTVPTQPIIYDGKLGEQYKIFILNVFLGIITLGIYHYWGRTRQRRYTTSSTAVYNDRFEYTGYGGELFWGMIKALIIIGILSIPFFWALSNLDTLENLAKQLPRAEHTTSVETHQKSSDEQDKEDFDNLKKAYDKLTPKEQNEMMVSLSLIGVYIVFYYVYIPFVAVYGSLRYRVTHSRWRGIRGHMVGSMIVYGFVGLVHTFLKIITLGLWIPFADGMTYKYKMNRLFFGNQQAKFSPEYGTLFVSHLLSILLLFASLALISLPGILLTVSKGAAGAAGSDVSSIAKLTVALCYVIGLFILFICRFWYKATFVRMRYNNLTFGNIGFICKISGWGLVRQTWGNVLILIFTLGLGYPIVIQRRMKFFCKHTVMTGDIQKASFLQASGEKDKAGEGLSSMFNLNIGLF